MAACLSNCARYEYPFVPPGKKGSDGKIHAELCDPTDQKSQCYRWKVFCTPLGGAYDQLCPTAQKQTSNAAACNVTPPVPAVGGVVPIPQYASGAFHGACWVRGIPSDHTPKPRCSGDSFIKEQDCPADVCTNPFKADPGAQPPFGHCADVSADPNACIGDDTIHQVMRKAYTWPNDPQTYVDDAPAYRVIFSPGGKNAPITPSVGAIPLCSSLPEPIYDMKTWWVPATKTGLCSDPIVKQGAVFAVAHPKNCNSLAGNCNWACKLSDGNPSAKPPVLPGSGDDGVICRWK